MIAIPLIRVTTPNSPPMACGTHLQGYIHCTYAEIVAKLGHPNAEGDSYKVDAEWCGHVNGMLFTIYNYKDGKNYLGNEGVSLSSITDWHIGGKTREVVTLLNLFIKGEI